MTSSVPRFAWYRFRATLARRWGGYLTVVLLVGLLGGVAMAALAGARRTQSSFSTYLAATGSSDLDAGVFPENTSAATAITAPFYAHLMAVIAHLPDVARVAAYPEFYVLPLRRNGTPLLPPALNAGTVATIGSINGQFFDQDRVAVTQGRLADPGRADEFVATAEAAHLLRWHVGQVVYVGAYTFDQAGVAGFGNPTVQVPATLRVRARLTGLVVFQSQIVRDDVDRYPTDVLFTPAFTRRAADAAYFPTFTLRLVHGARDVATVEHEIIGVVPRRALYNFHVTSVVQGQVQRAIKPEAIALGTFGAIAALAALLIAGLSIGRVVQATGEESTVLRGLGATPAMTLADGVLGTLGAVVLGAMVAAGVAVGLSPLAPIGPVRQVDPSPGVAVDWTVLGTGLGVLVVGLGAFAVALAARRSPQRRAARGVSQTAPVARLVGAATRTGLPSPAVTGIRFALDRGPDRAGVPVRSALLGAVLAVLVVVTTLTFASGLNTLVSNPPVYGWNWSYAINGQGGGQVPPQSSTFLARDRDVTAWTGYGFANAQLDGQTVPILTSDVHAALAPPILSGHAIEQKDQIVLGTATLAQLHKKVGQTVLVSYGAPKNAPAYIPPTPLVIVGTATLPTIGNPGVLHVSMGTGAMLSTEIAPAAFRKAKSDPDPNLNGPAIVVVKLRSGVPPAAGLASLRHVAGEITASVANDPNAGGTFQVLPVQRPAEIVNYQSTGATPATLATGLAAGAVVALALTLVASVRRRRRELALLKVLGFTQRQLAAAVAWQASVAALVGVVVGVPLGITLGRWLWILFAEQIYAVPRPTVPVLQIVGVAAGAMVLANVVALLPGRVAARTKTAILLRAE